MTQDNPGPQLTHASDAVVARIRTVQSARRIVTVIAVGLLIYAWISPPPLALVYARTAAWGICGILSVVEGLLFGKAGQAAGSAYINALIYFAVAALPLFRSSL